MRLGEYDLTTENDGIHADVGIVDVEVHEDYDDRIFMNDLAILYLEKDVKFNGK